MSIKQYQSYGKQFIDQDDISSVIQVLKSDYLTQGPASQKFEKSITNYCKVNYSVTFSSATAALHLSCLALDLRAGDLVWTSPITFVASSNSVLYFGGKVDFIDIHPETFNIDVSKLEEKLILAEKNGDLPKAIIVVHFGGASCDLAKIKELSNRFGFKIIEDASHAIGATYKGHIIGSCKYSDITVFSLHPVKIITAGEGGIATTNNQEYFEKMQRLRSHGLKRNDDFIFQKDEIWQYDQLELGYNYRLSDIQAGLGISQLEKIGRFVAKRNHLAEIYRYHLDAENTMYQHVLKQSTSAYHLFVIQIEKKRNELFKYLRANGIGAAIHYIPVYKLKHYQNLGFPYDYLEETEKYFKTCLTLPLHYNMQEEDVKHVINCLKSFK